MSDPRLANFTWDSPEERCRRLAREAAAAFQDISAARDRQDWETALSLMEQLDITLETLHGLVPEKATLLWNDYAKALAALTGRLQGPLALNSPSPLPEPRRSDLIWRLTTLLDRFLIRPASGPAWLPVVHTQLLLHGAIYWRDRLRQTAVDHPGRSDVRSRTLRFVGRAAARVDPVPVWLITACEELGVSPMSDPQADEADRARAQASVEIAPSFTTSQPPDAALAGPTSLDEPAALTMAVEHWLSTHVGIQQLELALTCSPGASLFSGDGSRLELNLAAIPDPEAVDSVPAWIGAVRGPLQTALAKGELQRIDLLEPFATVISSLEPHWQLGERLQPSELQIINRLIAAGASLLAPDDLRTARDSNPPPAPTPSFAPLQLSPDPIELAVLLACDHDNEHLHRALARLRREYLCNPFWDAPVDESALLKFDPLECLRLLQRDGGFYAASLDALGCLERWRKDALACLDVTCFWAPEPTSQVFNLITFVQESYFESQRLPLVCPNPGPLALLDHMAGREVLVVSWSASSIRDQHHSGRAFRLFDDRPIAPYGLRAISPPDSRHPRRPHIGFPDSLDDVITAVEQEHARKPIDLVLVETSAYRLPLLLALHQREIQGFGLGAELMQLFGLDRSAP